MEEPRIEQGSLTVRVRATGDGSAYWDAQWRYRVGPEVGWKFKTKRLGPAWQIADGTGGWKKRPGRCKPGFLDDRAAMIAATAAMAQNATDLRDAERTRVVAATAKVTVRALAAEWLEWLEEVRDAKPSTLADYRFLLREPGVPHKRGGGVSAGRIMAAFGDRPFDEVRTVEVSRFLRSLDKAGLTPRNVNKHRQVLAAIFTYACRDDTYGLALNPAAGTDKRREETPPALDYYELEEVEALAGAVTRGAHRWVPRLLDQLDQLGFLTGAIEQTRVQAAALIAEVEVNPYLAERVARHGDIESALAQAAEHRVAHGAVLDRDELAARAVEDRRDAELFRLLFYTGLRIGEVLTLRWEDVNLPARLLLVRRGLSDGQESTPKGRRHRFVPLSSPAVRTLERLGERDDFLGPDDYVVANRWGRRLDPSAVRRRYKHGCVSAGLRPVKLHGLRHAAGSLIARTSDPVFVRDFLGHAKLSTTDRYLSSKTRPEEYERLDRAFGATPGADVRERDSEPQ